MLTKQFYTLLFFFNLLVLCDWSVAQVNQPSQSDVDTVVVHKEPVIIVKRVIINSDAKSKPYHQWIDFTVGPVSHTNLFYQKQTYQIPPYMTALEYSTEELTGYAFGVSYNYTIKNIYFNLDVSLCNYRERFTDYSITTSFFPEEYINTYTYLDPSLRIGYDFKVDRFSFIPYAGMIAGTLLSMKGKTLNDKEEVVDVKDSPIYKSNAFAFVSGLKIMFNLSDSFIVLGDAYYREDIASITRDYVPFTFRRKTLGLKLGIAYRI